EEEIAKATAEEEILKKVMNYVKKGWPEKAKEPEVYEKKKDELSEYHGCLIWQNRMVIPQKFQKKVMDMLHLSHYGRNRMLVLARGKVWYPGMTKDIERIVQ